VIEKTTTTVEQNNRTVLMESVVIPHKVLLQTKSIVSYCLYFKIYT